MQRKDRILDQSIAHTPTEDLKRELARSLELTAKHLYYMATIWRELESRGEDLSSLRHGLAGYLPLIANGLLDANVLVRFAGQKTLLAAMSNLALSEQQRVLELEHVVLVKLDGERNRVDLETPLEGLSSAEVYRVFDEHGLREPDKQYDLLVHKQPNAPPALKPPRRALRVRVDAERKLLLVSNTAADINQVLQALSDHYGVNLSELIQSGQKTKAIT